MIESEVILLGKKDLKNPSGTQHTGSGKYKEKITLIPWREKGRIDEDRKDLIRH